MFRRLWMLLFTACLLYPVQSLAAETDSQPSQLNLGLGVGFSISEYRRTDQTILPLPIFSYSNSRFYIRGLAAGLKVYEDKSQEIALEVLYLPQHFYSKDSSSRSMKRLDDRYSTAMLGANYQLRTPYGSFRLGVAGDILDTSNGFLVNGNYSYPFPLGDIVLTPRLGVIWADKNYNDYYYGVSSKEAAKSGYNSYTAHDSFSPYAGLNVYLKLSQKTGLFLDGNIVFLSDEVRDSPMVDKKYKYAGGVGFTTTF